MANELNESTELAADSSPSGSRQERFVIRDSDTVVTLPSIGLGTLRTSATYAALLIQLEGDRSEQVSVLDSIMEALGIHPEEINHNRKNPGCIDEKMRREWELEAKNLRLKLMALLYAET